jgi:hypothetical protein
MNLIIGIGIGIAVVFRTLAKPIAIAIADRPTASLALIPSPIVFRSVNPGLTTRMRRITV